ncbi:hypothetical protein [Alishewanella longhuensis]
MCSNLNNNHIVKADDGSSRLVITSDGENTFATVITERGVWSIRGKGALGIMYQNHDPFHNHQNNLKNDYLIPPEQPIKKRQKEQSSTRRQSDVSSNELAVVDVYIIYNQAVENLYGVSGALTRINHLLAVTNDIYQNSNVNMRVNALRIDKMLIILRVRIVNRPYVTLLAYQVIQECLLRPGRCVTLLALMP